MFPTYGKIETLFERDVNTFKVVEGRVRRSEFAAIPHWDVTEKIDGTNVRVNWTPAEAYAFEEDREYPGAVRFGGRTDRAHMPTKLMMHLQETFAVEKLLACFPGMDAAVTLFGEGYGAGIQKGGNYRPDPSFRLFDVLVHGVESGPRIWLKQEDVADVAKKLEIQTVPFLGVMSTDMVVRRIKTGMMSTVALLESGKGHTEEGVVARSPHGMLDRLGQRIMWKLKTRDF